MESKKDKLLKKSEEYKIPNEGSLGLLAYGDKGVRAWRKVRRKERKQKQS